MKQESSSRDRVLFLLEFAWIYFAQVPFFSRVNRKDIIFVAFIISIFSPSYENLP